jgi:hypothetical protein
MEDIEANKEALSQAVETLMATTAQAGAGRKRKASSKTTDNIELEQALKKKAKKTVVVVKSCRQLYFYAEIAEELLCKDALTLQLHFHS